MPISATDTIALAFQHTKRQLLQPFRLWQWTRLALVGLLAGEMGSGGGGSNLRSQLGAARRGPSHFPPSGLPHIDPAILGAVIAVLVISGFVFFLVMLYVSSVMRFVLFDSVLQKECRIREGWSRRQNQGWNYFLWHLGYFFITFGGFIVLLGIPAAFAFGMGWFSPPREHVLPLVLFGILVFFLFIVLIFAAAVVQLLTKDFVVPQMALEGIGAIEGWRRLWPMIQVEKGGYAVYIVMKVVLAIGAGIVIGIASIILALLVAIPVVGVVIAAVVAGKTTGLTWNASTITAAVVAGCVLLAIFLYLIALISVPAIVFFPAYSIYFFAARYRPLSLVLYPPPPGFSAPPAMDPSPQLA